MLSKVSMDCDVPIWVVTGRHSKSCFIRNAAYLTWMCESTVSDSWPDMDSHSFGQMFIEFLWVSLMFMIFWWFSRMCTNLNVFAWIWMDMDWYALIWIDMGWYGYGYMDMDEWIYEHWGIWMHIIDGWVSLEGEGCCPLPPRTPLTRIFMRGSAPQTPHRFNG